MGLGDFIEEVAEAAENMAARAEAKRKAAEYKAKANKYRDLIKYLDKKMELIKNELEEVEQELASQHKCFSCNPESAKGMLITTFDGMEQIVWKKQYEAILTNMSDGVNGLSEKVSKAGQLQEEWEEKAKAEEAKAYGEL